MTKTPSYYFCLRHFQLIMDLDWEELNWKPMVRGREIMALVNEYKKEFRLQAYRPTQIWTIIKRKHTQYFDYLLWDIIHPEK